MRMRWLAALTGLVMLLVGAGLGALPASAQGRCVPTPGTQECLSRLFADNGVHFNAKAWQADIDASMGTSPGLLAELKKKLAATKGKQALVAKVVRWFDAATAGNGSGGPPTRVPSWSRVDAVCRHLMTAQGYKYDSGLCRYWWQNFVVVTGWQMDRAGGVTKIIVSGYLADQGPTHTNTVATLQFPKPVPMPDTAAWTAEDSPLPLIAWFNTERRVVWKAPGTHGGPVTISDHEMFSVGQLLGLWGWGDANVEFSTALRKLFDDAGFNPVAAGGPNIVPSAAWPAFGSRGLLSAKALKAAGWLHPFPQVAMDVAVGNPLAGLFPVV